MFATAALLLPLSKLGMSSDITPPLLRSVEMAVEILEAMDESVVAQKSAAMVKNYLVDLRASATQSEAGDTGNDSTNGTTSAEAETHRTQRGVEIPVSKRRWDICCMSNLFRNGLLDSCFPIILSKDLLSFSVTRVDRRWELSCYLILFVYREIMRIFMCCP